MSTAPESDNKASGQCVSVGYDLKERHMPSHHCPKVTRQPTLVLRITKVNKKCWRNPEVREANEKVGGAQN